MTDLAWTVCGLRSALANGSVRPTQLVEMALERANSSSSHNTYLWRDTTWSTAEATRVEAQPRSESGPLADGHDTLWGLPISVKDCFDLAGAPTSCGVRFYRDLHGRCERDSWLVDRLRRKGAVLTGKTHLHPLAYGITGENPEFGNCLQPWNADALTGGSSSGAAASVQEGSAVAAIGTDTGGSIRVPAALCGLAGYRASLGRGNWDGAAHLAPSFDTMGWLFRDLEDAPLLADFFTAERAQDAKRFSHFAVVEDCFLHDCEPEVVDSLRAVTQELEGLGLRASRFLADWWADAFEIFAPIQAWEAARIHADYFDMFDDSIRERLEWGARITADELVVLRRRHAEFTARMNDLVATHQLLLLPAAPVARLAAGADHRHTRSKLLRYTTPISLAGLPVVTIPCVAGGIQIAAERENDESLVQLAALLGGQRKRDSATPRS